MYEVTYSVDGTLHKVNIQANDYVLAQQAFFNMYKGDMTIINIRRIS